ncbi:Receptor-like protein kinase ANXUR2 [Durusdinium trenchii]|uniref:Receptor-like protein kinase ANXUR2 n=1 Tax=Durusdinium trenchii TaxID=1381693 RepID=A0ABP0JTM9_9DINO
MATGFGIGFLDRWKSDWIDPALNYIEGRPKTDSHLNEASNEYSEEEIKASTKNFDPSCLLGSGTFGSVYRGTMNDGTEVAIKVLHVPEEAGFEEEVQVLSRFRHPNLVILMGFARHEESIRNFQVNYRTIFLVPTGDDYTLEQRSAYLEFALWQNWAASNSTSHG